MAAHEPVRAMRFDKLKVFTGSANAPLAKAICRELGTPLGEASVRTFSDGETHLQLLENVRGADVFVVQPTCSPVDRNLMEVLLMMDALKRASAQRITAVLPYYGYARQDRKDRPRMPISAKLVASLIETAGAHRVLALDLHAAQIQGFFDVPTDNLFAQPDMAEDILKKYGAKDLMVISPDVGGVVRARALAKRLEADLAIVDKRREKAGESEVMNIIGDVEGRKCILIDDMTDSGGTLINAADALLKKGAKEVAAYVTHGVLSNGAAANIDKSQLKELVITDTIPPSESVSKSKKIRTISLAPLIGEAIRRIANDESISKMFD
jgi:ribose-phosphate pyrophosphokinase